MMRFPFWVSTKPAHLPAGLMAIIAAGMLLFAIGNIIWVTAQLNKERREEEHRKEKREKGLRDEHR